jgi:hypothetical protein
LLRFFRQILQKCQTNKKVGFRPLDWSDPQRQV